MIDRRRFLAGAGLPAAAVLFDPAGLASALELLAQPDPRAPDDVARDEDFWNTIAQAFPLDRSFVNLNHGGVSPAPAVVLDAMARHVAFSNHAPSYTMWRILRPRIEIVRERLAGFCGVDAEEIALTRNASESLQICQFGMDLQAGDHVLTTTQDYPRMLTTFRQRARREGIVLDEFDIPTPSEDPGEIVRLFEERITERTNMILMCHVINLTGQVLPVREVVAMARRHDVPVVVDGAHAFAHLDFRVADMHCDYYAASLHKWLHAPIGTGVLYVRKERIPDLWPLMAADEARDEDIRKFEEVGTFPVGPVLAIGEALSFHEAVGSARKFARMVYLRDRWAVPLSQNERIKLHTSLKPGMAGGIALVEIDGIPTSELHDWLWSKHGIWTTTITKPTFGGLRVSPSICSTLPEVDRFTEAMDHAARHGIG
jgi:selenocysteine lyase/cysteine desulfurase